ncbi:hypothetical protein RRG08_044860 [Elysia crispata]|uniref:Uncharacterized protein n=1 Tax=Elysia crispata TaxID=231223 RepID=A0AAE1A4S1_9GAST|nr:hypothetical protein RRG08_044860 [Elysia crispata]
MIEQRQNWVPVTPRYTHCLTSYFRDAVTTAPEILAVQETGVNTDTGGINRLEINRVFTNGAAFCLDCRPKPHRVVDQENSERGETRPSGGGRRLNRPPQ